MEIGLKAIFEHIEDGWYVFHLDGGGHLELPVTALATPPLHGTPFHIRMSSLPFDHLDRAKLAKALLNQILKPGNS